MPNLPTDPIPAVSGLRSLGTGSQQAVAGDDYRLSPLLYANTAASTTLTKPGAGTETNFDLNYTVPASLSLVGRVLRVTACIEAAGGSATTFTTKLKMGSVTLSTTTAATLTATTQSHFSMSWLVKYTALGASGTITTSCPFSKRGTATLLDTLTQTATVDTTGSNVLQVSATWSTSLATNIGTLRELIIERLN